MKSVKEAGPVELESLRRRTYRSLAMGKITSAGCDQIISDINALDRTIQETPEIKIKEGGS